MMKALCLSFFALVIASCQSESIKEGDKKVEYLIVNGLVYDGAGGVAKNLNVGICGEIICYLGNDRPEADLIIEAQNLVVTPGFIDPHTHSLEDMYAEKTRSNLNYLMQGVTTVVNGNDGEGLPNIKRIGQELVDKGIGTNVALLVGHGAIRKQVMGIEERAPTSHELEEMKILVSQAMEEGALGFSTGLYYVPGIFSNTKEVIELAKIASSYGGIYDTHLRDESTFNIGFLPAVKEAIQVAKEADIHLHIAHIKALGVDVWGQSKPVIRLIEAAQEKGVSISADQYPWQASGTYLNSAVMPSWIRADSDELFHQRLQDESLKPKILTEIKENIRRRGGAETLLITESDSHKLLGKNLKELAKENELSPEEMAILIALTEKVRVASFNMDATDIENFMQKSWVVTASDGTNGHPRKYASFPKKFQKYVKKKNVLTLPEFIKQSSGATAEILGLKNRGLLKLGYFADINIIDLNSYSANANFSKWNQLSTGIEYQFVNGQKTIGEGQYTDTLAGQFLSQ